MSLQIELRGTSDIVAQAINLENEIGAKVLLFEQNNGKSNLKVQKMQHDKWRQFKCGNVAKLE